METNFAVQQEDSKGSSQQIECHVLLLQLLTCLFQARAAEQPQSNSGAGSGAVEAGQGTQRPEWELLQSEKFVHYALRQLHAVATNQCKELHGERDLPAPPRSPAAALPRRHAVGPLRCRAAVPPRICAATSPRWCLAGLPPRRHRC